MSSPPEPDFRAVIDAALNETLRGHTLHWWSMPRARWGGLTADQLADLGCFATVAYAAKDTVEQRNRDLRETHALWFDPTNLSVMGMDMLAQRALRE